jgi:hypothetical protein
MVVLPREVAEAIEGLREKGWNNAWLIQIPFKKELGGEKIGTIKKYAMGNLETYMTALINGYEIEKSPEEKVREYYESHMNQVELTEHLSYEEGYVDGVIDAVEETLNLLGIKIEGVNDTNV